MGAGAVRGVETEIIRGRFIVRDAGCGAHEFPAEITRILIFFSFGYHLHHPFAHAHGGLNGLIQSGSGLFTNIQTIDYYFNVMGFVAVQLHPPFDLLNFAIYPHFQKALF